MKQHGRLNYFDAFKLVSTKVLPFATARAMFAMNTLAVGWGMGQLGSNDVAASQFITSLQYVFVGISRGMILSTGVLVGEKNGADEFVEVGKISRASWKLACVAAAISIASILGLPKALEAMKLMDSEVQAATQAYLNFYAIGVPVILGAAGDQQLAVATGDGNLPLAYTAVYSGLAASLGLPMALNKLGPEVSGSRGFGIATALSSWSAILGVRAYFHNKEKYQKFKLINQSDKSRNSYLSQLLSLGWKFGLQSGAEFANVAATTALFSAYGFSKSSPVLQMIAPAMQVASAWGLVSLGMGQAQAALIANERGAMQKALAQEGENHDQETLLVGKHNISVIAFMGLILGNIVGLVLALSCLAQPNFYSNFFLNNQLADAAAEESSHIVKTAALGLIFDTSRNILAGNLKGFRDVNFATGMSFLLMTVMFVAVSSALLFGCDVSPVSAMWIRNAGIAAAACVNAIRWRQINNMSAQQQAEMNIPDLQTQIHSKGALTVVTPLLKQAQIANASVIVDFVNNEYENSGD